MNKAPVFLERRSYRLRRVMDAIRLLPVLGLALWMVPLLWPVPDAAGEGGVAMSTALLYLFGVWIGLVLIGWFLWRRVGRAEAEGYGAGIDGPR